MKQLFDYLLELEQNNNRPWYHEHKEERLKANGTFEALVQELIFRMSESDPELIYKRPKELIYRIPRDVRVWKDRPPYNPSYRASITSFGKTSIPVGPFICIQPLGRSFLAGGLYTSAFREATLMVREYIYYHGYEFMRIISEPDFSSNFEILGEKLKNVPREFDPSDPWAEYLKNKSWFIEYPLTDEQVLSEDLGEFAADIFRKMKPFNDYLNEALAGFRFPQHE